MISVKVLFVTLLFATAVMAQVSYTMAFKQLILVFSVLVALSVAQSNKDKPGECPRSLAPREGHGGRDGRHQQGGAGCEIECNRDSDCRDSKKCCATYCGGRSCTVPQLPQQGNDNTKPGQCPARVNQVLCRRECERDSDCRNDNKCCRTNCDGTKCTDPLRVATTTTTRRPSTTTRHPSTTTRRPGSGGNTKPGVCTPNLAQFSCSTECHRDSDCPRNLKCCPTVCQGAMCSGPMTITTTTDRPPVTRPGCPVPSEHPGEFICRSNCSNNSDCNRREKCCANKCGALVCTRTNNK